MRILLFLIILNFIFYNCKSQSETPEDHSLDDIKNEISDLKDDTSKVNRLNNLCIEILNNNNNLEEALKYSQQAFSIAEKLQFKIGMANAYNNMGEVAYYQGDYTKAKEYYQKALNLDEEVGNISGIEERCNNIGLCLNNLGENKLSIEFFTKALNISIENNDTIVIAQCLGNLGNINVDQGNYIEALDNFNKALLFAKAQNNKRYIGHLYGNIGNIYFYISNYPKALSQYFEALRINEELNDISAQARQLGNIGAVYFYQQDYQNALDYYFKALDINIELNRKSSMIYQYGNIGSVYQTLKESDKALEYYFKSMELEKELQDKSSLGSTYGNIGVVYLDMGDTEKAMEYTLMALDIEKELGEKENIARRLGNIGVIYKVLKNYKKAEEYILKASHLADSIGAQNLYKDHLFELSELYSETGRYKLAHEYYKKHISVRDTVFNQENKKAMLEMGIQYEYDKKSLADSLSYIKKQEISEMKHQSELHQEQTRRNVLIAGLLFIILLAGIIYRSYRHKKRDNILIATQKDEVERQKELVEEKNRDIMDSIEYAKRIQTAILPPQKIVKEYLKDSFILYKPKDIVAGDFYWMEHKDNKILFAAADCTGHGVPGAMVSVVCNNGLNRAVREHGLTEPGQILDKTREIVIQEFEKSEEEVKDGMDIALCSLEGNRLQYAGAHNPLWIVRNGEILETKSDRQPIGMSRITEPFTTHSIDLQKGDTLYIFSDGYVDQFGGVSGKKFKSTAFKHLLLGIQDKSMDDQRIILDESFEAWKGKLEQIDDVCIIGVRIN